MANVISRLKLESGEFDSKIKRAGQEMLAYSEHCRKMGLEMGYANRDAKEFAKQLGSMATVSTTARGKINELSEAFVNAKVMYKNMTDAEKQGEFGKNLAASLDQLKSRLNSAKQDLADVNKELAGGGKFGEFGNVIDTLGSKLGVTGNLTEMLTSKTALLTGAVGAGIAIVTKATEAWAGYNAELAKQDQITTVTTGLKGEDADRMTDKMRALADTYNVDFREAVNAANTLMTQFGKTGDEATQLIKDGMQGMIQGDGPKLLSMIQQYAPAFRDAGVSASQLVAVIQNSEGGIFTDQNMNAIVMGIKNIRLMTKATSDALAQLGIDGQKMSQQLSNGSLTIFDALKQVAAAVQNVNSNSQAAGEVMQQVFGRQGAMAGTKLGEAIATLNTNLEETKRQTGEVGVALAELQTANERLNTAIRDCFEYDGWDQMANGIKANLVTALATVLDYIGKIKGSLADFVGGAVKAGEAPKPDPKYKNGAYWERKDENGNVTSGRYWNNQQVSQQEYDKLKKAAETPIQITKPTKGGNKTLKPEKDEMVEVVGLIGEANERVSDLQKRIRESWDQNEIATLRKQLKEAQNDLDVLQGKLPKDSVVELTITANDTDALQKVKDIDGVTIDPKTMTVTANTSEALQKVQELVADVDGKVVNVKVVPVLTDADIEKQLQKQYGKAIQVPITPKLTTGDEFEQSIRIKLSEQNVEADMQALRTMIEAQIKNGIEGVDIPSDWIVGQIFGEGVDIPDEYWRNLQEQINEKLREMNIEELNIDFGTGKDKGKDKKESKQDKSAVEVMSQMNSGIHQIVGGIEGLGIKVPEELSSVVSGINSMLSILQGITILVQGIAAMQEIGTFLGIIPGMARGGIVPHAANGYYVPGNSFSGDNTLIAANAGELILSKSAQGNLASMLNNGGLGNLHLETYLDGRAIRIVLNNESQGRMKGKYVTSNNVR